MGLDAKTLKSQIHAVSQIMQLPCSTGDTVQSRREAGVGGWVWQPIMQLSCPIAWEVAQAGVEQVSIAGPSEWRAILNLECGIPQIPLWFTFFECLNFLFKLSSVYPLSLSHVCVVSPLRDPVSPLALSVTGFDREYFGSWLACPNSFNTNNCLLSSPVLGLHPSKSLKIALSFQRRFHTN